MSVINKKRKMNLKSSFVESKSLQKLKEKSSIYFNLMNKEEKHTSESKEWKIIVKGIEGIHQKNQNNTHFTSFATTVQEKGKQKQFQSFFMGKRPFSNFKGITI